MDETTFVLRPARPEDAACLHELHTNAVRALCASHYSLEIIDGWLCNRSPQGYLPPIERGAIFVAEGRRSIVGFGEAAAGVVVAVYVHPAMAHRGIGTAILRHALEVARRSHAGPIRVESTLNASGFYEKFGFRVIERSSVTRNHVDVPIVLMEMPVNSTTL